MTLTDLVRRAVATVFSPREEARDILALDLPREAGWQLLALVTLLSVLAVQGTELVLNALGLHIVLSPIQGPFALTIVQLSIAVLMVFAIYWGGRAFGGSGRFADTIVLMAWLQFVLLCLQVVQIAFLFVLPVMASYVSILGIALFFWLLTSFVAVIHGFDSLGRVFAGIVGAILALGFVFTVILTIIGFQIPEVSGNV